MRAPTQLVDLARMPALPASPQLSGSSINQSTTEFQTNISTHEIFEYKPDEDKPKQDVIEGAYEKI